MKSLTDAIVELEKPGPDPAVVKLAVRQRAACAWLTEHKPETVAWQYGAVLQTCNHIFGKPYEGKPEGRTGPIEHLEDLFEAELERIWVAVPEDCKEALEQLDESALVALTGTQPGPKR